MRLENYITHGEYLNTIELAYKVKKIYGINTYFLFKKMCMVAAFKAGTVETEGGLTSYITYNTFLSKCSHHIFHALDIGTLFNIRLKYKIHEKFFGVPAAYIFDFNVLELDEFLTNPTNFINVKLKKALEIWGN
jgi:hypothetical protein